MIAIATSLFITVPPMDPLVNRLVTGVNADNFLLSFFIVNIWLALFNLIPAFPMDGGRVLRAILALRMKRAQATNIAAKIGQMIAIGFVLLGLYSNTFLFFIGIFIFIAASSEALFTETKSMLEGATVKDVLMRQYQSISSDEPLSAVVKILLNGQAKDFIVLENSKPVGTLNRDDLIRALSNKGDTVPIHSIMNREINYLQEELPLEKAYLQMQQYKYTIMPVLQNNQFVGMLDIENILEYLMIKKANKGNPISSNIQPAVP